MSKPRTTPSFKRAALKEQLTMIRDMVNTLRDAMPDIDKGTPTTANLRRECRRAILKLLAVWETMHEYSELPDAIKEHRRLAIGFMQRTILQMMKTPVDEDGESIEGISGQ
jgi:hypothetical protein